jgi:hypothetical protein
LKNRRRGKKSGEVSVFLSAKTNLDEILKWQSMPLALSHFQILISLPILVLSHEPQ